MQVLYRLLFPVSICNPLYPGGRLPRKAILQNDRSIEEKLRSVPRKPLRSHLLQIQRMQEMLSKMKAQLDGNNRTAVNGVGRP